jgi:hypothetical protein
MRRGQRVSARGERIIHGADDTVFTPQRGAADARMPRGRAKIRELDESGVHIMAPLVFEERVRHAFAADQFGSVGADVTEAAAALSVGLGGGVAVTAAAPGAGVGGKAKAAAAVLAPPVRKRAFSLAALPKPLKHLLAGAFSGGALRPRAHATRTRARSLAWRRRTSEKGILSANALAHATCRALPPSAAACSNRRLQNRHRAAGGGAHEAHGRRKRHAPPPSLTHTHTHTHDHTTARSHTHTCTCAAFSAPPFLPLHPP